MSIRKTVVGAVAVLALGAGSMASAVEMSLGGGAFFAGDFGGGPMNVEGTINVPGVGMSTEYTASTPWVGGGINAFFDVSYAEVGIGLTATIGNLKEELSVEGVSVQEEQDMYMVYLNLSALGKYPINIGSMTIWPAAGIEYALCVATNLEWDFAGDAGDLSQFWIKFGGGMDFALSESLFLRTKALYGIGFTSKGSSNLKDIMEVLLGMEGGKTLLSHGLQIGVGIGFKL